MKKIFISFLAIATFALIFGYYQKSRPRYRPWMGEQICEDLASFSKEDLNPVRLENAFMQTPAGLKYVHFKIKDHCIYWKKNWKGDESIDRVRKVCIALDTLNKRVQLPDMDFLLTVHDGIIAPSAKEDRFVPVLCFAKIKEARNAILFPDPLSESFAKRRAKSISLERLRPRSFWKNKIEKAFWRGTTTGGEYTLDNWYQMPRVQLSLLSQYYPDDIDAGFSTFHGISTEVQEEILKTLPQVRWTGHKKHLRYKYLVVADGNTCTYPRYYLGLYSGSLVFKDETNHYQWFYRALKPYKHYVPVKADFSDLPEKVKWAKEHDEEARKIAANSVHFVNQNLLTPYIYGYMERLLKEYAKLQDANITIGQGMELYQGSHKTKWPKHD